MLPDLGHEPDETPRPQQPAAALADEHRDRNRDRGDSDSRLEHPGAGFDPGLTKEDEDRPRDDPDCDAKGERDECAPTEP